MAMNSYVSVILDPKTGLHHGALYMNHPTPSGADRFRLSLTLTDGSRTAREAALAGNAAFPGARQLDPEAQSDLDLATVEIPSGATVTLVTPVSAEAKAEAGQAVEIRHGGQRRSMGIDAGVLDLLVTIGRLRPDSSSGNDPGLHYRYDHYVAAA